MAFALPMFPEYSIYGGDEEVEESVDGQQQSNVIRRHRRAPMLRNTERSHSAPHIGQRLSKSKFGSTDETDVAKILREKQGKKVDFERKSADPAADAASAQETAEHEELEIHTENKRPSEPAPSNLTQTENVEDKKHKLSRGESVLVLLRRFSAGKLQLHKPGHKAAPKPTEDSQV